MPQTQTQILHILYACLFSRIQTAQKPEYGLASFEMKNKSFLYDIPPIYC